MNESNQSKMPPAARLAMPVGPALQVLADLRSDDQIVVTSQGSAREWPKLCEHPLDFHYIPSTMSGNIPLGLGLALAQPHRHVLAFTGDGSLLMNLGSLVTIAASGAANLTVVLVDNGVYEVTGGQKTAASDRHVDFAGFARSAGIPTVGHFDRLDAWRFAANDHLQQPGPRFISLVVEAVRENYLLDPPCPIVDQVARLRTALSN